MNTKAYLVAHFRIEDGKPVYAGVGIYSESADSLTGAITRSRFAVDLMEWEGSDYADAKRGLLLALNDIPGPYSWVVGELAR